MKKLLAISMILAMLLGTVVAFPVSAAPTEATFDDHLVTHWDFEGSEESQLLDKASAGISDDNLTKYGTGVEIENGIAYIPNTEGDYLSVAVGADTDLKNFAEKTIVTKVKMENVPGRSLVAAAFSSGDASNKHWSWHLQNAATDNAIVVQGFSGDQGKPVVMDEYRICVMTFTKVPDSDNYKISCYQSTKEFPASAADFDLLIEVEGPAEKITNTIQINLGRRYDHLTKDRKLHTYFDDFKVYDIVMDVEDVMATIKAPSYKAAQTTDIYTVEENEKFDIRFSATMDTTSTAAGFDISATYTGATEPKDLSAPCTTLLRTLTANNGLATYTATTDFNSQYIMALTVTGVDASIITEGGEIVFTVTPYAITNDQKVALETIYVTVTYADGEIVVDSTRTAPVAE